MKRNLDVIKSKALKENVKIDIHQGNALNMSNFPDESFDYEGYVIITAAREAKNKIYPFLTMLAGLISFSISGIIVGSTIFNGGYYGRD